jgi:hypothetical protein
MISPIAGVGIGIFLFAICLWIKGLIDEKIDDALWRKGINPSWSTNRLRDLFKKY